MKQYNALNYKRNILVNGYAYEYDKYSSIK